MSEAATKPEKKSRLRDREVVVTVHLESVAWTRDREAARRAAMEALIAIIAPD